MLTYLYPYGYSTGMDKLQQLLDLGGIKKDIAFLVISGLSLIASIFFPLSLPFDAAWVAIVLCGLPIILGAIIALVTAFDIKADMLVSLALIASIFIGEHFAAGEVAFIMQLGGLLEEITSARARKGIEKLVRLTPRTARVLRDGKEQTVNAEEVRKGDILRVLPGETIPVDGIILSGNTSVDQSIMTGEPLPADKGPGEEVSSGTVNQLGVFEMQAVRVGEDSSIQRMVRLVQSADAGKARIVRLADRWATWVVIIAVTAALLTWLVTGEIIRAVTILVVFCPCSLVLATPTAIVAATGNATKHGFLVKEGDALERLAASAKLVFDKTGTLTYGQPELVTVRSSGITEEELFSLAASAEKDSEHPLGKAVVRAYRKETGKEPQDPESFKLVPARGIAARTGGHDVLAGNPELMEEHGIAITGSEHESSLNEGAAVIHIAVDGAWKGFLALSDTIRHNAERMVREVKAAGFEPVLLTGDHEKAASHIAGQLGIKEYRASCLPEDKLNYIKDSEEPVCMIGDGINDAPALKAANASIAMGGIGSDIAIDAADITLVNDDLSELPELLWLSKKMMGKIKHNLAFSMTLNFIAIALAMTGILNPVAGALVHNAGSVFVVLNSALLLSWRKKGL